MSYDDPEQPEWFNRMMRNQHRIYTFHRDGGFYPLEMGSDAEARANAECNPGTLRVEAHDGRVVWPKP